jgi:hypothetical protein
LYVPRGTIAALFVHIHKDQDRQPPLIVA